MSLVVAGQDLGNPLLVALALRDVARQGEEYPQLYALPQADEPESPDPGYVAAVRRQARQALQHHEGKLENETVEFLKRLVAWDAG